MVESSPNRQKTLLKKEKSLVTRNFSFSHSVFKRLVLETCEKQGLFGKGLKTLYVNLSAEDLTSNSQYSCDECGRQFTSKSYVKQHKAIVHRQEKPFVCSVCGKSFSTKTNMKAHMVVHYIKYPSY